jgi:PAS domain S-box-containing protein
MAESRECIRCLLANERESYRMEKRYFSKNGSVVWADVSTMLHRDAGGKPLYLITSIVDIIERKRAEEAVQRESSFIKAALDSLPGLFYLFDKNGKFLRWNTNFEKISGYTAAEISRMSPLDFFETPERELVAETIKEAFISGMAAVEAEFVSKDRTRTPHLFTGNLFSSEGAPSLIGMGIDITDRVRAEEELGRFSMELERSNVDLQQFAYVASHDLQEPLRMISSYLQLIERRYKDRLDSDANDFINFAVGGATRLQALISGLLEFSRVRTHGKPFESVNVDEVLDGVRRDLELQIEESGATVSYSGMPVIRADMVQITRLFQNLVQNGIKFRREGMPPLVGITADKTGNEYIFCVRDNGIGIEEQYAERIFVIFQRLHGREEYPGTGIGLSICKRIVERHGGRIWVESKPGEGSAFYFSIPAADVKK